VSAIVRTEEEYSDLVAGLNERFSGLTERDQIRDLVRAEVSRQVGQMVVAVTMLSASYYVGRQYGAAGWVLLGVAVVGGLLWTMRRDDLDPSREKHLIVLQAEDVARCEVIGQAQEAGENVWVVKEPEYAGDKRKVILAEDGRWDGWWKRVYDLTLEFEKLSPRKRRGRVAEAAKRVDASLEQGFALAAQEGAERNWWASSVAEKASAQRR
jgi:hypothetical protein